MTKKFSLHKKRVENCQQCSNDEERKTHQDEDGYCRTVQVSDGLGARCVGEWGEDKVTFLSTYVDITGTGLKKTWSHYYYIEICSGPGLCVDRGTGKEFIGTAIASLLTEGAKEYSKLFFFDLNPRTVKYLRERIERHKAIPREVKEKTVVEIGDYTKPESITNVLQRHIPPKDKGLNVIFVDPTDLSVPFALYNQLIGFGNRSDFIINFAFNTDLKRNIVKAFENKEYPSYKKYHNVLGASSFFKNENNILLAKEGNHDALTEKFEKSFLKSFANQGYTDPKPVRIRSYYKLIFLSTHPQGAKFWNIAIRKTAAERESGQLTLFST